VRIFVRGPYGRRPSAGFTLVEMLVTLVIFAVVAVTLTLVVMNSAKSKQSTTQRIESEQGARAAVDLMARDIRSAGYGADMDDAPTSRRSPTWTRRRSCSARTSSPTRPDHGLRRRHTTRPAVPSRSR
jgi:uncharacterized protein (TIGR02599 family)